jgi:hypothetical protein
VLRIEVGGGGPGDARRVAVPSELRTDKLRDTLNRALGLDGDPVCRFEIDGGHVSDPRAADEGDVQTAEQVTLSVLANGPGHLFMYHHDLDHDRACIVVVEDITAVDPGDNHVVVFADEPGPDRPS